MYVFELDSMACSVPCLIVINKSAFTLVNQNNPQWFSNSFVLDCILTFFFMFIFHSSL